MIRVYDVLAPFIGVGSAVALLVLIFLLLLGPTRKLWVLLLYVSWELFGTVGLTVADLRLNGTSQPEHNTNPGLLYSALYWTNDVIVDLLRFVLLAVLIYQVVGNSKPLIRQLLTGLVVAMVVLPFLLFHPIFPAPRFAADPFTAYPGVAWFNSTGQLLNFGDALMNVILWGALIQAKKRDPQVLAVSIGLGILVTSFAFGYGLRHFVPRGEWTATFNLFLNLMQLAVWLIWCRAFWPVPKQKMPDAAVASH